MLFHIEERLSTVPRWSVVNTIQKQTVDQHSFRVALIAPRIANIMFGISEPEAIAHIMMAALQHDVLEGITGDTPGYLDSTDVDNQARHKYANLIPVQSCPYEIGYIIKVSDLLESLIFLNREISMGNQSVRNICVAIEQKLARLIEDLHKDRRFKGMSVGEAHEMIKDIIADALGGYGCMQNPMMELR